MLWKMLSCVAALGMITTVTTAADFPPLRNTQPELIPFLTPQQALAKLRLPEGFKATLFAAEPDVQQPIALAFDPRGRLWVAENYTYAERPLALDRSFQDRLIVLEDANQDGKAEKRTVFYDRFVGLTSVETGFGGVFALAPPQLLFIPDADGDLVPDSDPVVLLDGFDVGPSNTHNFANGLKWGPDGWLYGRVGITAPGLVGVPGTPPSQRVPVGPSIWRYHPVTKVFEEVATGTTNAWGHDWDNYGELFFINTVINHLWYVQAGAHFTRMFGADRNPYVYQLIEHTADHFHWDTSEAWNDIRKGVTSSTDQAGGGHAHCGMTIYQGENWPAEYRDKLMTLNLHGRRINVDRLERQGASYVGRHEPDIMFSDDPWFRGIEILYGPDGGVYIADWSDIGECHENDGVHRTSGRIFKITYGDAKAPVVRDLTTLDSEQLAELQFSRNEWLVRQARRVLVDRKFAGGEVAGGIAKLQAQVAVGGDTAAKLRAMWTLSQLGALSPAQAVSLLSADDEHLRVWGIRFLLESGPVSADVLKNFANMARTGQSGLVLTTLASALQKLPSSSRWPIAGELAQQAHYVDDRMLPLMIWYGVEAAVPADPQSAVKFAITSKLPLLTRFTARRLAQGWDTLHQHHATLFPNMLSAADDAHRRDILIGMNEGLRGWRKLAPPPGWSEVQAKLEQSSDETVRNLSREISVVFGDGRAMDQLREMVTSVNVDLGTRRSALQSLIEAQPKDLADVLRKVMLNRDLALAPEAIKGLATVNDAGTGKYLIDNFNRFDNPGREAALQTLTARPETGAALVAAIAEGKVPRSVVSVQLVRQLQGYDHARLQEQIREVWPELRPINADKKVRIEEFRHRLTGEVLAKANLPAGRMLWQKTCVKCHTLFGEGAKIGPDLTGSQRHNLDYLLENIVDPSSSLLPQFRMTTIVMNDGRVINGVVVSKTEQTWDVQTPTEKVTLRAAEVDETSQTSQSLMPEGLLDLLSQEDVINLMGYVMSPRQVALPPEAEGAQPLGASSK